MEVKAISVKEWLRQMQVAVRGGADVFLYDDPHRRMFGFVVGYFASESRVVIGISDIKRTMNDLDGFDIDPKVLRDCLSTPEGRDKLPGLLRTVPEASSAPGQNTPGIL